MTITRTPIWCDLTGAQCPEAPRAMLTKRSPCWYCLRRNMKQAAQFRRRWETSRLFCFGCDHSSVQGSHLERHEIASGNHRAAAEWMPEAWLHLCSDFKKGCHRKLQGINPPTISYALKKIYDRKYYCRETLNGLRRRAPNAITEAEVDAVVSQLEAGESVTTLLTGADRRFQGDDS